MFFLQRRLNPARRYTSSACLPLLPGTQTWQSFISHFSAMSNLQDGRTTMPAQGCLSPSFFYLQKNKPLSHLSQLFWVSETSSQMQLLGDTLGFSWSSSPLILLLLRQLFLHPPLDGGVPSRVSLLYPAFTLSALRILSKLQFGSEGVTFSHSSVSANAL